MEFFERMKEIRTDADETQQMIAEILNISQPQYQLYESGKRYMPIDLFQKFCKHYNVSSDYILGLPKNARWPRR